MKKIIAIIGLFVLLPLNSDTFVVKKKRESSAKLKEKSCQLLEDVLHLCIDIHEQMAHIQRQSLVNSCQYLENDKESFFAHASKDQLQKFVDTTQELVQNMIACKDALNSYKAYTKSLK